MVVEVGLTTTLPDAAPPVLKFVPVQDVVFEDQVRVDEPPVKIAVELALMTVEQAGAVQPLTLLPPSSKLQSAPPLAGFGLVQVRAWVPVVPQAVALQASQELHPPLTLWAH